MRMGPFSNAKVAKYLNEYFVPVYVSVEDHLSGKKGQGEEKLLRSIFKDAKSKNLPQGNVHVYLLDPKGDVRAFSQAARATSVWGEITRVLHSETVNMADEARRQEAEGKATFDEDERMRQDAWKMNAEWASVLEGDESLRQPTRCVCAGLDPATSGLCPARLVLSAQADVTGRASSLQLVV